MKIPEFSCYCDRTSSGNALVFSLGEVDVYFSYKTPIALRAPNLGLVVRKNEWGPTTGKHLNAIDGGNRSSRIPGPAFLELLRHLDDAPTKA